jgi:hypothetical protein
VERVNVNLPRPLLDDLRRLVPRSRRSEVIARATARELRRLKLAAGLDAMLRQPAWSDQRYPTLADGESIDAALGRLRGGGPAALITRRRRKS